MKSHFDLEKISRTTDQIEKYELIRRWLFELHEDVNRRREVDGGVTFDSLKETYAATNFVEEREKFFQVAMRAMRKKIITRDSIISLKAALVTLYGMYRPFPMRK